MSEQKGQCATSPVMVLIAVVGVFAVPVITIVMIVQLVLAFQAGHVDKNDPRMADAAVQERIKPYGEVKAIDPSAPRVEKTGEVVYTEVCASCHGTGALDAPKVISRVGSMQNLIDHVLQPIVGNYFRNSAQDFTVLDFLGARSHRQTEAAEHIRVALGAYDVQAIDTLIGDINPPAKLMETQTDRKIAEEQRKTYEVQEAAQKERQQLVRQTSLADIQQQVVGAEQGVNIAELKSNAHIKQATGEAEAIRLRAIGEAGAIRATGSAKAEAYRAGVEALGSQSYTLMQLMQIVGDRNVRIVPDVAVNGGGTSGGLVEGMLGLMLKKEIAKAA